MISASDWSIGAPKALIMWFLLLAVLASFAVQKLAIEREERHLQARFGKTYVDYAERVRRGSRVMCGTTSLPLKW
jgi:protein-S-isoprenylcysteine O-methyltransferase Ste14